MYLCADKATRFCYGSADCVNNNIKIIFGSGTQLYLMPSKYIEIVANRVQCEYLQFVNKYVNMKQTFNSKYISPELPKVTH